ncbi:aspartate-semialdehyde dehydrogenase [Pseudomonas aeruginosa]
MLPPIPQGLIPVTVQQDPPKPRPATPPVAPTQAGAGSDGVALRQERDELAGRGIPPSPAPPGRRGARAERRGGRGAG